MASRRWPCRWWTSPRAAPCGAAVGAKSGWSRDALSAVAQRLKSLLEPAHPAPCRGRHRRGAGGAAAGAGAVRVVNPADPFFTHGPFPWVVLGPVVVALRYGALAGILAALVVLAGWFGLARQGLIGPTMPQDEFLGALVLVMICGEFGSLWSNRVRRAETMQRYIAQRLTTSPTSTTCCASPTTASSRTSSRAPCRCATRCSTCAASPATAWWPTRRAAGRRRALAAVVPVLPDRMRGGLSHGGSNIRRAADHTLGTPFELNTTDPLDHLALERQELSHVALDELEQRGRSRYLRCR